MSVIYIFPKKHYSCQPEISNFKNALIIQKEITTLDISVNYPFIMHIGESL